MHAPTVDQVVELALTYFAVAGVEVTIGDEGVTTPEGQIFGLEPLRRRLAEVGETGWGEAVGRHFDLLRNVDTILPPSFDAARPHLRSAVVAEADLGLFEGAIMERRLTDGLGERLMLRRGQLGMTVTAEAVGAWDVAEEEVWAQAREGSLWDEPIHRREFRLAGGVAYSAVRGGRWTSTRVLALDRHLDRSPQYGALVAVPARDELLLHQIRDETFADAALAMLSHAASSYVESPLPIGCDLFWWCAGRLARICTPGQDRYLYVRVPEFSAMLWRLEEALTDCRRSRRLGRRTP